MLILFENIFALAPVVFTLWACGSKSELSAKTEFHLGLRSFSLQKDYDRWINFSLTDQSKFAHFISVIARSSHQNQ